MRIGIDVRYLSHGLIGGVHHYVASFVPELLKLATGHEVILYADTKRPFELQDLPAHVQARYLSWRSPLSSTAHDWRLRRQMAHDEIEVAHFPANYGFGPANAATVLTLHDEINVLPWRKIIRGHRKDARTVVMMTYLHLMTMAALRQASLVLTVSAYAKRRIAQCSHYPAHRIVPILHGRSPDFRRIHDASGLDAVRARYDLNRPFVLADALKNPGVLVRAWTRLPADIRQSHQIVFFCRTPNPLPVVHRAVAAGDARLLVQPSRAELIALYNLAAAFVFPSWIEGFGMPVLEAMACGAPVIASDRGALPEVAGDAALLMDAEDDAQLAHHLAQVLTQPAVAHELRLRGFRRADQFSWTKTAQAILSAYEQALDFRSSQRSLPVLDRSLG